MSSLADLPHLVGFFSYSREDDVGSKGGLSELRDAIQAKLSAQLGRSQTDFRIWQDKAAISLGALWEKEIAQGIKRSAFFIPIVTPRALRSQHCSFEFQAFLARETELGREDLVFPILYIPVPALEDERLWRDSPVLKIVATRQYLDWRDLRPRGLDEPEVRTKIIHFCRNISSALHKSWVPPHERQRRAEEEARQRREEEQRREAVRLEAARLAQEERRRRGAEAAQRAEELERTRIAEEEARRHAADERRRQQAAAAQRLREEAAFVAAKRTNTIAAIEEFLASDPAAGLASEAQRLLAALRVRAEAYERAIASDDPVALGAFRDAYKKGVDVDRVRERLRALRPPTQFSTAKPAILVPAALAVVLIGGVIAWLEIRPGGGPSVSAVSMPPPAPTSPAPPAMNQQAKVAAPDTASKLATVPAPIARTSPSVAASPPPLPPAPAPDELAWSLLKDTFDQGALERFIAQFPDSARRKDAERRVAMLAAAAPSPPADQIAWSLIKDSKDPDELRRFVQEFPNSSQRPTAEQRIASLAAAPPPVAPPDARELARALQFELQRVGCFDGTVNGKFDDDTKMAWHRFIRLTSLKMPDDATSDAVNAVRSINKRVCPVLCSRGEHAEGDSCVANEPPPKRAAKTEHRAQPEIPPPAAPSVNSGCQVDRNSYAYSGVGTRGCTR